MTFTKGCKWPKTRIVNLTLPRQLCHFVISAENSTIFFGYFQTLCDKLGNHFSFFKMMNWCFCGAYTPKTLEFGYTVEKNKMSAFCRIQIKEKFSCWSYIICQKKTKNNVLELLELEKIHLYYFAKSLYFPCFSGYFWQTWSAVHLYTVFQILGKVSFWNVFFFKSADYQNKCEFNLAKISWFSKQMWA